MTPQDNAEILTGYLKNLTKDDRWLVTFVPATPKTDWAGAIGSDAYYRLSRPDGGAVNFGTEKSSLPSLKSFVRKAAKP